MPSSESTGKSQQQPTMKAPSNLRGYRILRPLGSGGMGSVWVAEKITSHQQFAVKFLKEDALEEPENLARFEREIDSLRAIRHPNVVNVFDFSVPKGDPEARPYVVMELLQGEGLDALLRRQRALSPRLAVNILLQVLDGLAAAHAIHVIHRDLGPSNIFMVSQPGGGYLVKLLDFGLARPIATSEEGANVTQKGTLMGKPGYIAPEMFSGKDLDGRSDIFACGMILHRMLAGKLPFRETQSQLLWMERYQEQMTDRQYPHLCEQHSWIPVRLGDVVAKAIHRKVEERYQSVEDLQVDLLDLEDSVLKKAADSMPPQMPGEGSAQTSTAMGVDRSTSFRKRRLPLWLVAAGTGALVFALVLFFALGGGPDDGSAPGEAGTSAPASAEASAAPLEAEPDAAEEPDGRPEASAAKATVDSAEARGETGSTALPVDAGPEAAEQVLVVVAGAPPGAVIRVGDVVPEGDPPKARLARSEDLVTVVVEAPGFARFTRSILPTADQLVTVEMRPLRRPPRRDAGGTLPSLPEDLN